MKTFLVIIYTGFLLMLYLGVEAQNLHNSWIQLRPESNSINYKLPGKRYYIIPSYIGSKFLSEEWSVGTIVLENGDRYDNLQLKLNTREDELIEYNRRIGSTIMLDKPAIAEFSLSFDDGHTEQFKKIFFDRFPKGDRYFCVLYTGRLTVLLWYKTEEQQTSPYHDIHGIMHASTYVLSKNYYMVSPDHDMVKFRFKRRAILSLFPEQKKQVRRIIRKNHVSFNDEKEISRLFRLIETEIL